MELCVVCGQMWEKNAALIIVDEVIAEEEEEELGSVIEEDWPPYIERCDRFLGFVAEKLLRRRPSV